MELDPTLKNRLSKYLTTDQLEHIHVSDGISHAVQQLTSLRKTISSFLPLYLASNEDRLKNDNGSLSEGTFMFADVSGFTALSERLMLKAGADGIEILTDVFNDYFATMLEMLAKSDGYLLKFAGDALLTFFPASPSHDEFPKAVKAGLRMQRKMQERFQPIQNKNITEWFPEDPPELTMSVGISRGKLFEALVGNIWQRDHMIMGALPGQADAAEEAGTRDDVIIDAALQQAYSHEFDTRDLGGGFYQVIDNFGDKLGDYEFSMPQRRRAKSSYLFSFNDQELLRDLQDALDRLDNIARYVSSEIVNKLVVGGDHIESENRLATVIFVHFTGFAELLERWGDESLDLVVLMLSRYYVIMQGIIASNGGVLTRSDPYKLGSKLLITFGAPVAHPDDADRAVATALEMNRQLEPLNRQLQAQFPEDSQYFPFIKQRMGITQGDVFAGEVGWRQRREYTVMGDDVNLAARLMSKAEFGTIYISQPVWERVRAYYETEELPLFPVKGKSLPIHAYKVLKARHSSLVRTSDTKFVGREVTLLSLNMALQQIERSAKRVRIIGLNGDMGVGKTRLMKQLTINAENSGFRVAWATCRAQNTRKAIWSALVGQLLGLELLDKRETQQEHVHNMLHELGLSELKAEFDDLLFNITENTKQIVSKFEVRAKSKTRNELFDKLSSDHTLAMKGDDLANFRKNLKKNSPMASATTLPLWNELEMRQSLTEALMRFLKAFSQKHPVLLAIDDLHKENQRAINVLKKITQQLEDARVMIIVAYEPQKDLELDLRQISVSDLTEEETYLMASAMLNTPELGPNLSRFLWESTSGRALYIESLVQALRDANQLVQTESMTELRPGANVEAIPDNVRGLVISRIDMLSATARNMVKAAAVLDDVFHPDVLRFVADIQEATQFDKAFDELVTLQIFEDLTNGTYRFKHGVAQQAVYEELSRLQRQKLHLRTAQYLSTLQEVEENILDRIHHLLRGGDQSKAMAELSRTAQQAEANQDIEQALELYMRALELFPYNTTAVSKEIERLQHLRDA